VTKTFPHVEDVRNSAAAENMRQLYVLIEQRVLIAGHELPRRMMRWAAKRADASIAVSRALALAMQAQGIASHSLEVLRNGVDLNRFQCLPQGEARLRLQWPEVPTLISVGNLIESKGQRLAIEALRTLTAFRRRNGILPAPAAKLLDELRSMTSRQ